MNQKTLIEAIEDEARCELEMLPATQGQIRELWKAIAITAIVVCMGFCVAFYRLIYG